MVNVERIIERIRANGADVVLKDDGLHVVNRDSLPAGAMDFIRQHSAAIVELLRDEPDDDRPAPAAPRSMGWMIPRETADCIASLLMASDPGDPDWTWFVSKAMAIIDTAVQSEATAS